MCTVSWLPTALGFELFCNRDESRSRARARPPRVHTVDGTRFLAPIDGDAGGTWLAVNEHGVALSLLNRYDAAATTGAAPPISRGQLVMALAAAPDAPAALESLRGCDLERYRPFTLLVIDGDAFAAAWDGATLTTPPEPPEPPLTSSSWNAAAVATARRRLWSSAIGAAGGARTVAAARFHRSHRPRRGPSSPCMHRDDAHTVSFCHLRVTTAAVALAYAGGPPCRTALEAPLVLARRRLRATA